MVITCVRKRVHVVHWRLLISIHKLFRSSVVCGHHLLIHVWIFRKSLLSTHHLFLEIHVLLLHHRLLLRKIHICIVVIPTIRLRRCIILLHSLEIYRWFILHVNIILKHVIVWMRTRSLNSCVVPYFVFIVAESLPEILVSVKWVDVILHLNSLLFFGEFYVLFSLSFFGY